MRDLINIYKYDSTRAVAPVLAKLLASSLREISVSNRGLELVDPCLVALPTISRHVRERGFDHMKLLAKKLALEMDWSYAPLLVRAADTVQVGATSERRQAQAKRAYALVRGLGRLSGERDYVLIDDVWTTGSSILAAKEKIFQAGARKINIIVVAKTGAD